MNDPMYDRNTADVQKLAEFLDSKYKVGGMKIGWDAIIGLIPGVGDIVTSSMSFYILFRAALLGCPPFVLMKMGLNILIDNIVDFIPVIGAIFDFFWKSNNKNVRLLQNHLKDPVRTSRSAKTSVILSLIVVFIFVVIVSTVVIYGLIVLITFLYHYLQTGSSYSPGGNW